MNRRTIGTLLALLAAAAFMAAVVPARASTDGDANSPASVGGATASLDLRAELRLVSIRAGTCPPGASPTLLCPSRAGEGSAPGLGQATVAYSYIVDEGHPTCFNSAKILGYPVRLSVVGKGELQIAVAERSDCVAGEAGISAAQTFTITGGTGMYQGAAGSGTVTRALSPTDAGAVGTETWMGTLTVPGLEFDTTRPTFSGVANKVVKAKRGAKSARVAFRVTAQDDRDGTVATRCTPASGAKFKIGRTRVTCTAADSSANAATAVFSVTVRRAR